MLEVVECFLPTVQSGPGNSPSLSSFLSPTGQLLQSSFAALSEVVRHRYMYMHHEDNASMYYKYSFIHT